jgi:hypothetical protein
MAGPVQVLSPEQKAEKIKTIVEGWYAKAKTIPDCEMTYKNSTDMRQVDGLLKDKSIMPYTKGERNPIYWAVIDYERQARVNRITELSKK